MADNEFNFDLSHLLDSNPSPLNQKHILDYAKSKIAEAATSYKRDFPEVMNAKILNVYPNNTFDLTSLDEEKIWYSVPCILPGASQYFQPQQVVHCRFHSVDTSRPYIKGGLGVSSAVVDLSRPILDKGNIIIPIDSGMWIQDQGFYWLNNKALGLQSPPVIVPVTSTYTESFSGLSDNPGPTEIAHYLFSDGSGFVSVKLASLPSSGVQNFRITSVLINGTDYTSSYPPDRAPGYFPVGIQLTQNTLFFFNVPDSRVQPSFTPQGPPVGTTISTVQVTYTFQTTTGRQIITGVSGTGPDTAYSPRGLCMIPSTTGQIIATLLTDYRADGGEVFTMNNDEQFSYTAGTYTLTLTQVPAGATNLMINLHNSQFDGTINPPITIYNEGLTVYGLAQSISNGYYSNGQIDITYMTAGAGTPITTTDTFPGDGSKLIFTLTQTGTINFIDATYDDGSGGTFLDTGAHYDPTSNSVVFSVIVPAGLNAYVDYSYIPFVSQTDSFPNPIGGQTAFNLSKTPLNSSSITVPVTDGDNGFHPHNTFNLVPLLSGQTVRFAVKHNADASTGNAQIAYSYQITKGQLFHITGQRIREINLTTGVSQDLLLPYPAPFDATPETLFGYYNNNRVSSQMGKRWQDGWFHTRWGYLHYDPVDDSYTVVSPVGIFYRSRMQDTGASNKWTLMPWPEEDVATDKRYAGWSWTKTNSQNAGSVIPVPGLKKRTAPWYNYSVASKYAIQGSWGDIGPNIVANIAAYQGGTVTDTNPNGYYGSPIGVPSENDYALNVIQKGADKKWSIVSTISVRNDLVAGNEGSFPLYIQANGSIYYEAGFQSHKYISRRAATHITSTSWMEADWFKDQSTLGQERTRFHDYKFGLDDAGLTINAIDMAGTVTDQLTFKCDPSVVVDGYAELDHVVDYGIAHTDDQFIVPTEFYTSSGYITYHSNASLGFPLVSAYAAGAFNGGYNYLNGYGYVFNFFCTTALDGPAKAANLLMPGIPNFAHNSPNVANTSYQGTYGRSLTGSSDQKIVGDENDNIYFCLHFPYWVRGQNETITVTAETIRGVYTQYVDTYLPENGPHYIGFDILGYEGAPIISGSDDLHVPGSSFAGIPTPDYGQGGYITPFVRQAYHRVMFPQPQNVRDTPYEDPGDPNATPPIPPSIKHVYAYHYVGEIYAPWTHDIPHRQYCHLRGTYTYGDDRYLFYNAPGYIEHALPWHGAAIYDVTGDHRQTYLSSAKTIMYKYKIVGGKFVKVWEHDISDRGILAFNYSLPGYNNIIPPSVGKIGASLYDWKTAGRYLFLLRKISPEPVSHDYGVTTGPLVPTLEVWLNTNTEPSAPIYSIDLTALVPDILTKGTVDSDIKIVCGVGGDSKEWVVMSFTLAGNSYSGAGPTPVRIKFTFSTTDASYGVVTSMDPTTDFPTPYNFPGLAQANNEFAWTDDNNAVTVKSGG